MSGLDAATDMFALVDVLIDQPMLRRALSDPSAQPEQRVALARRLFGQRVGAQALDVLAQVVGRAWRSPGELVLGLEAEGVRSGLKQAQEDGGLDHVTKELHAIGGAVARSEELTAVLRSANYDLDAKRGLVARLLGDGVSPVTKLLATRAVNGHERTFSKAVDSYLEMAARLSDSVVAKVTVARPLDDSRLDRLRRALSARTGKPVSLQVEVDPDVLGGMHVAIGHEVYESTVASRLEDVRRQLVNS